MKRINFLGTEGDVARIKALQLKLELTLTDVIRQAIRLLHKKEIDQVKNVLLVVALSVLAVSCGGQVRIPPDGGLPPRATPTPTPTPTPVAAAFNSYFNSSMIGQVWIFQNADASCTTTYHVNAPPPSNYYPAGSIVLNITKSSAACYWAYGTDQASIDFVLSPLADGSYQSKGWVSYFPTVIPSWSPWHIYSSQVQTPAGALTPYMIVPPPTLNGSTVMETSYNRWDFGGQNFNSFVAGAPAANVYWKTSFYMQGSNAVSEQWEGTCGHEKWTFAANRGLIAVEFPNDASASCTPVPSSKFISRVTPTPPPTITSAQVFSNTAQTWNFVDGFGHHMMITPSPIACAFGVCADITVWHYTKDSCAGYWNPRTPEQCAVAVNLDELYFVLRHDADGAWRCIGFTYIDYTGQKWKVQILQQPGQAPPYTIIPVNSSVGDPDTSYGAIVQPLAATASLTDFAAINSPVNFTSPWRTDASAELLGSLTTLVSLQHEGCVTEKWNFGNGLERVAPIVNLGNGGVCLPLDSRFTMVRVH